LFFEVLWSHNSSAWDLADLGQYAGSFVSMHACAGCRLWDTTTTPVNDTKENLT
jgi:hypothetical protein